MATFQQTFKTMRVPWVFSYKYGAGTALQTPGASWWANRATIVNVDPLNAGHYHLNEHSM